jgi:hypothetical protein
MSEAADQVERFMAAGNKLMDAVRPDLAISEFRAAWASLPEPKDEQEPAVHILAAIADCHFFLREWDDCRGAIQYAFLKCGADPSNPFLRLRLGQSFYELGDQRESANWLVPVYLMEGRKAFEREDPKYLESFRSQLKAPAGGWPEGW